MDYASYQTFESKFCIVPLVFWLPRGWVAKNVLNARIPLWSVSENARNS